MARRSYRDPWVKKAKWLTQALIISGTLNIGLLSTFIYFAMSENKTTLSLSYEAKAPKTELSANLGIQDLLTEYSRFSFQDLLLRLANSDHVESGFTRRDLALACLVRFHHFNLERALGGLTLQKREISFTQDGESIGLTIYPGLADYQYQAIAHYAKTEKWPLTAQGLYFELQSTKPPYDPSLLEAFYLTPEFHFISLLFSKTGINLKKEHLASLLTQSDWGAITEFSQHLRNSGEFTSDERKKFLLQLCEQNSRLAAKILIEIDQDFLLKNLDNEKILSLCNLLGDKTNPPFLRSLLQSPRDDEIWKRAASILYEQAAEDVPDVLDLAKAKRRFLELKADPPPTPVKAAAKTYKVISGDSLWKIAHLNKTSVKALRQANDLKSDKLKIGQTLIIP